MVQMVPVNESREKWTLLLSCNTIKHFVAPNPKAVIESFYDATSQDSSKTRLTVLYKNEHAKNFRVIFKIETTHFPNDPLPESSLWYILQGNTNLFMVFITVKEKSLSAGFVEKWAAIFETGKLVYE